VSAQRRASAPYREQAIATNEIETQGVTGFATTRKNKVKPLISCPELALYDRNTGN